MKYFKDKNGETLEIGDLCYYTELPYSNYADSLVEVISNPEEDSIRVKTLIVNVFGKYQFHDGLNTVPLKFHTMKNDQVMDLMKISKGSVGEDLIKFMEEKFPLKQNEDKRL